MIGREVWTEVCAPQLVAGRYVETDLPAPVEACYNVPLFYHGQQMAFPCWQVELLARGPDDFADDVPPLSWGEWLNECRRSAIEKPEER